MKKMEKLTNLEISHKAFYLILCLVLLLAVNITVLAFNSGSDPNIFGHSGEEIEVAGQLLNTTLEGKAGDGTLDGTISSGLNFLDPSFSTGTFSAGFGGIPSDAREVLVQGRVVGEGNGAFWNTQLMLLHPSSGASFIFLRAPPVVVNGSYILDSTAWIPLDSNGDLSWDWQYTGPAVGFVELNVVGHRS